MCPGPGGAYEGFWVREICGMGEQSRPPSRPGLAQAAWALLTERPRRSAGDGGLPSRGKAGATGRACVFLL